MALIEKLDLNPDKAVLRSFGFIGLGVFGLLGTYIYWAGGLSEVLKIAAIATTADLITIPHGHSTNAGIHFSVSQSPIRIQIIGNRIRPLFQPNVRREGSWIPYTVAVRLLA